MNDTYTNSELASLFNVSLSKVRLAKTKGLDFSKTNDHGVDFTRMVAWFSAPSVAPSVAPWLPTTETLPEIEWHPDERVYVEQNGVPVAVTYKEVKLGQEYRPSAQPTRHPEHGNHVYSYEKSVIILVSSPRHYPNGYCPPRRG